MSSEQFSAPNISLPSTTTHDVRKLYTYRTLLMEFAEDYDLWETFQYLPGAESLKFQRRARFDPCPMSPSDWKLHVGTFTSREGEREEIVRTHLSNREGKHGTSTTPRFYLTSGKRLIMSELRLVKFFEPFGIVSTLKGLRFTERINLLILFYYLERGVMGQLSLTRKEVVTIMKACREIAEVAKNNGGEPCRKRETAEEALKRGFRIELPSEPEGEDYADPPPPYEHKHINQIQSSEAQGKAYETEDVTWKPAAMVERQRPLIPSCADSSSMCSEPRLQQLEPKLSGSQEAYPNQIRYLEPKSLISVYQSPKPTIYGTDSVIALTPDAQFDDPEQIPDSYVHLKRRIFSEEGHGDMKNASKRRKTSDSCTQTELKTRSSSTQTQDMPMEMKEELARLRYQLEVLTNQQQVFLTKWDIETGQLYAKHRMNLWSTQQELATEKTARMRAEARSVEDVALRDDAEAGVEEMEAMRPESFKFGKLGKEVEKPGRSD